MNFEIIIEELNKYFLAQDKVINFFEPHDLKKIFDFDISKKIKNETEFVSICNDIVNYSVHTNNKFFFNQLFAGSDTYTTVSEMLITMLQFIKKFLGHLLQNTLDYTTISFFVKIIHKPNNY